jgi:sulfane dehydrogenase subunit SoxC
MDETGQIQPTPAQLQEVRGTESIYHNNGIQTWQVKADGAVENGRLG